MTKKTATLIKPHLEGFNGTANLYRLDPPMGVPDWKNDACDWESCDGSGSCSLAEYVIVSATFVPFVGGEETYIFPATPDGEIDDWGELPGSFKGEQDHDKALERAGYEVTA